MNHDYFTEVTLPERIAGKYTFKKCLKQSDDKKIYLLEDEKSNSYILKMTRGKQIAALRQEKKIYKALERVPEAPVPKLIDFWDDPHYCCLLRTYVDGCSLAAHYDHKLYFSEKEIIDYALEICGIIRMLHAQDPPIVNLEINPENFVVQKGSGRLYLVDFAAPKKSSPPCDERTDIHAIGKTLLYLTCGNTDLGALSYAAVSKPFRRIILCCTDYAPKKSYPDIDHLIRALERYRTRLSLAKSDRWKVVAALLLVPGIGLGYITGVHVGSNSASPSITTTVDQVNDSLDHTLELSQYQEQIDQILQDYYANDREALKKDCEKLLEALTGATDSADDSTETTLP